MDEDVAEAQALLKGNQKGVGSTFSLARLLIVTAQSVRRDPARQLSERGRGRFPDTIGNKLGIRIRRRGGNCHGEAL